MSKIWPAGLLTLLLAACGPSNTPGAPSEPTPHEPTVLYPALRSAADSLAWRIVEASGGAEAWEALPRLRFDFVSIRDTASAAAAAEAFRVRHLWDRTTGRYRIEYPVGEDSLLVALLNVQTFDPDAPAGTLYLNGAPLDSAATRERLGEAYARFINDTYWLLAPLKLFDPGVHRALAPDSSRAGEETLALSFEGVGLTPGDRYWMRADTTGRLRRWTYWLQSGRRDSWTWSDPVDVPTPRGPLHLATRKQSGGRAILTPVYSSEGLPADVFERPAPAL